MKKKEKKKKKERKTTNLPSILSSFAFRNNGLPFHFNHLEGRIPLSRLKQANIYLVVADDVRKKQDKKMMYCLE